VSSDTFYAFYAAAGSTSVALLGLTIQQLRVEREAKGAMSDERFVRPTVRLRISRVTTVYGAIASLGALALSWDPPELRASVLVAVVITLLVLDADFSPRAAPIFGKRTGPRTRAALRLLAGAAVLATAMATGVIIAPSRQPPSALASYPPKSFRVYGTCVNDACGLNHRVRPQRRAPTRGRRLLDGELVLVLCQRYGDLMSTKGHRRSRLWDLLNDQTWVSDLFVTTSKSGPASRDVPRCPPTVPH
jgi:hypothetical protein